MSAIYLKNVFGDNLKTKEENNIYLTQLYLHSKSALRTCNLLSSIYQNNRILGKKPNTPNSIFWT